MSTESNEAETAGLSPDAAFSVLGDETRLEILRTLGEADHPLPFSALFERIDYHDSSNFSYHLEKLVGHFVYQTEQGYLLGQPGRHVVQAVMSGAVTDVPLQEPTPVDRPCPFCSADIEMAYQQERVEKHCPECSGLEERPTTDGGGLSESGNLGHLLLPPAGLEGRAPEQALRAAEIWTAKETIAVVRGVCPQCSGLLDQSVTVCENHEATEGRCDDCGQRFATRFSADCSTCIFDMQAPLVTYLAGQTELMEYMMEQGMNPLSPEAFHFPMAAAREQVISCDPLEVCFTFVGDGDSLAITIDDEPSVVDVVRQKAEGAG